MLHGGFSYCVVGKTLLVIWIMPNGEHGDVFDRTPNKSRRKTKTEREMFKCSNVHWYNFSTRIARTLLYKGIDKLGESQK